MHGLQTDFTQTNEAQMKYFFFVFLASAVSLFADRLQEPITSEELCQDAWIGFDADAECFFRLDFHTNGTSRLAIVALGDAADVYNVHWQIRNRSLTLLEASQNKGLEAIALTCSDVGRRKLVLTVTGRTNNWKKTTILYPERRFTEYARKSRSE
jgi:hypothetical protein